jgi:hypothetical protein
VLRSQGKPVRLGLTADHVSHVVAALGMCDDPGFITHPDDADPFATPAP